MLPGVQMLFWKAAFWLVGLQHILLHGGFFILPQVQGFAHCCVKADEVPVSPFFQVVEIPLDGSMALWCISCSSLFSVIKVAEGNPAPSSRPLKKCDRKALDKELH